MWFFSKLEQRDRKEPPKPGILAKRVTSIPLGRP